jgi:peptide/nickel transport system permease protein
LLPVKYLAKRALILGVTVVIATYLTVVIANAGGLIDQILSSQIRFEITQSLSRDPAFSRLPEDVREKMLEERITNAIKAKGLDQPFIIRSFIYLIDALTLRLGKALVLKSNAGSREVADIILERLPNTIALFTTATIIYSIIGIIIGLYMTRKPGGFFDRFMAMVAVITGVIPPWFFAIIFLLIFAFYVRLFPLGGFVSVPAPSDPLLFALDVLYHMALPLITWTIALFPYWAYVVRNIVIQTYGEDFVTIAKAKGLSDDKVLRRYVLRPSMPPIITNVALSLVFSLQGALITEVVFNWPGIGYLLNLAILSTDAPIVIGITVITAYLLVITVFILEILYSILDPRIRVAR